jgi:hypothetical protein
VDGSSAETIWEEHRMKDMASVFKTPLISNRKTTGQRLVPACLLGTLLIATAGWMWGIGYAVLEVVNWLLA